MDINFSKIVLPLFTKWIEPKVIKLIDKCKTEGKILYHDKFQSEFEDYLIRRYEKFYYIDTLVFQHTSKPFHELYQPLTLIEDIHYISPKKETWTELKKFNRVNVNVDESINVNSIRKKFVIKGFNAEIFNSSRRIKICDYAGMGKSTVIKKIFLSIIEENIGIPVLIELRKLKSGNLILDEILSQFASLHEIADKQFIIELINRGDFFFLLDGLDEIPLAEKEIVINDIHKFIEQANNNHFILASRPEKALSSFGSFESFRIKDLEKKEALALLWRYDAFNHKSIIDELISAINEEDNKAVQEFLFNPLLTTLIYRSYDYKRKLAINKPQFYRQIYDALYENHDLSKQGFYIREKLSKLHIDDFERMLRAVGFITSKEGSIEYSKNQLLEYISKSLEFCSDLDFNPSDFFIDITSNVPLFKEEGLNYKWIHKSMQDYFTARFIFTDLKTKQKEVLNKIFRDKDLGRFINILDIFMEMDYMSFRNNFIFLLVKDFQQYVAARMPHQSIRDAENIFYSDFSGSRKNRTELVQWLKRKVVNRLLHDELQEAFGALEFFKFDYEKAMILMDIITNSIIDTENNELFKM